MVKSGDWLKRETLERQARWVGKAVEDVKLKQTLNKTGGGRRWVLSFSV